MQLRVILSFILVLSVISCRNQYIEDDEVTGEVTALEPADTTDVTPTSTTSESTAAVAAPLTYAELLNLHRQGKIPACDVAWNGYQGYYDYDQRMVPMGQGLAYLGLPANINFRIDSNFSRVFGIRRVHQSSEVRGLRPSYWGWEFYSRPDWFQIGWWGQWVPQPIPRDIFIKVSSGSSETSYCYFRTSYHDSYRYQPPSYVPPVPHWPSPNIPQPKVVLQHISGLAALEYVVPGISDTSHVSHQFRLASAWHRHCQRQGFAAGYRLWGNEGMCFRSGAVTIQQMTYARATQLLGYTLPTSGLTQPLAANAASVRQVPNYALAGVEMDGTNLHYLRVNPSGGLGSMYKWVANSELRSASGNPLSSYHPDTYNRAVHLYCQRGAPTGSGPNITISYKTGVHLEHDGAADRSQVVCLW